MMNVWFINNFLWSCKTRNFNWNKMFLSKKKGLLQLLNHFKKCRYFREFWNLLSFDSKYEDWFALRDCRGFKDILPNSPICYEMLKNSFSAASAAVVKWRNSGISMYLQLINYLTKTWKPVADKIFKQEVKAALEKILGK